MKCKRCGREHNGIFGSGVYCCRSCANTRQHSEETKHRISDGVKKSEAWKESTVRTKFVYLVCPYCHTEYGKYISTNKHTCGKDECRRLYLSDKMKSLGAGGYRYGAGRGKSCWYESKSAGRVHLDSTYELAYAKWLDRNEIEWTRPTKGFLYVFEGVEHKYIPDFYLIVENKFIETKGFKTKQDESKWAQFPFDLTVLFKTDLQSIGALVELV